MPVVLAPAWCAGAGWVVTTAVECVVTTCVVACTRGVAVAVELEAAIELFCVWWTSELDVEFAGGCTSALRMSRGWKPPVEPAMTAASVEVIY